MTDLLFAMMAFELFLGGGGRLIEVGPITLRMVLFVAALVVSVGLVLNRRIRGGGFLLAFLLTIGFVGTHAPALIIGWLKGMRPSDIFLDLSPLLYWLSAPFFAIALQRTSMIYRAGKLIRLAALLMAAGYVFAVLGLALGQIQFQSFYALLSASGEFFFRGDNMFFYKGFLYLAIGIVFVVSLGGKFASSQLLLLMSALVLTLTRGLILATIIAVMCMLVTTGRRKAMRIAILCAGAAIFAVWFYLPSLSKIDLLAQRAISNSIRVGDLSFMMNNVEASTLLVGEGFGTAINGRLNIENSYLMILWKFGPFALLFWVLPFGLCFYYFRKIPRRSHHSRIACAYFFGVVLVYVQTATNPYLNNPIGLSFILIAMFSLRTLAISDAEDKAFKTVASASTENRSSSSYLTSAPTAATP